MKNLLLFVILIFGLFSSFNHVKAQPKQDVIWPLAVGNMWNYYQIAIDSNGNNDTTNIKIEVLSDSIINKEKYFTTRITTKEQEEQYVKNDLDGFYKISFIQNHSLQHIMSKGMNLKRMDTTKSLLFKYPLVGKVKYYSSQIHDTVKVVSIEDKIMIKTGQIYDCIKYQMEINEKNKYYKLIVFICPNIGLIKTELYQGTSIQKFQLTITWELNEPPILK